MLFNTFKHTSVEDRCHATSLTTPQGREEFWGTHRNVSPPLPPLYVSRSAHAKCPETLHAAPAEAPGALCSSCDCGAVISSWGEDRVLLWAERWGAAVAWTL